MPRLRHIEDAQLLRAMAHPLRLRLIGALRKDGPATASELARRLGESSGSTSYHLRQLARYGFVEEAAERNRGPHASTGGRWTRAWSGRSTPTMRASSRRAASSGRELVAEYSRWLLRWFEERPSGTGAGGRPRRGSTSGSS